MATLKEKVGINQKALALLHKSEPRYLPVCLLQGIFTAILPFVGFWFSARIINLLLTDSASSIIWRFVAWALVFTFLSGLLGNGLQQYRIALADRAINAKEMEKNKQLIKLDYAHIEDTAFQEQWSSIKMMEMTGGRGMMLVIYDALEVCEQIVSTALGLVFFLPLAFQPTFSGSIWEWADSPVVLLLFTIFLIGYITLFEQRTKKSRKQLNAILDKGAQMNNSGDFISTQLLEVEAGKDVRLYQQERLYRDFAQEKSQLAKQIMDKIARVQNEALPVANVLLVLLMAGGYYWILLKAMGQAVPAGAVVQYAGAFGILIDKLPKLVNNLQYHLNNEAFLKQTFDLLELENRQYPGTLPVEKRVDREYSLEARDVSFTYPGSEEPALQHLNLRLNPGEKLAVVGRNGSGKTTFIKLLTRLYDPDDGEIVLNDVAIQKYDYEEYLQLFSVVFQDFKLFSFKLGQNIAASEEVDEERALAAMGKAGYRTRFEKLAQGFATYLHKDYDENGIEVSGGEAQKIAMARAIYKDASIVILDEPTAALDPRSEYEVYQNFTNVIENRTAILISHRLSSTRFCDRIAVFEEGKIIQLGTHEELLEDKKGLYYELWHAQAQYYTGTDIDSSVDLSLV